MQARRELLLTQAEDFKVWLLNHGWKLRTRKGPYELFRVRKDSYTLIVYYSDNEVWASVCERDLPLVKEFLNENR